MKKYTFSNGDVITSELNADELTKRMRRLDLLRVMTEGYESGEGLNIYNKAIRAYNKVNNFTGIIRLTLLEKDFIGYMRERSFLTDEEKDLINFYTRY